MTQTNRRSIGPESARMAELGHLWIIADAYTKRWPQGETGQIIELTDDKGNFLATALLDPRDRIVARILSRTRIRLDRAWFLDRLRQAVAIRRDHAGIGHDTTAYRLVNAEGDGLPGLTVDRYGDWLMVQLYCNGWRPHLPLVVESLQELLKPTGIYEKSRPQQTRELEAASDSKRYGRLLAGKPAPERLPVLENGLTFLVSLAQGLNTGLFLDQRQNRRDLMTRVKGKRVLNLFAYTGAFSVAAAAAGARQVTSVDASPGYTAWARDNCAANGIDPEKHAFIVGDCLKVLCNAVGSRQRFEVILMDPPSFSTTSKSRFTTKGGTSDLVAAALPLLEPGGLLICSSNHQKVDVADYLKELRRGGLQGSSGLQVISLSGQPADFPYPVTFPEGRYLKYAICVKST